jgi:hypothetical protein
MSSIYLALLVQKIEKVSFNRKQGIFQITYCLEMGVLRWNVLVLQLGILYMENDVLYFK